MDIKFKAHKNCKVTNKMFHFRLLLMSIVLMLSINFVRSNENGLIDAINTTGTTEMDDHNVSTDDPIISIDQSVPQSTSIAPSDDSLILNHNKSDTINQAIKVYNKVEIKSKRILKKAIDLSSPKIIEWECPVETHRTSMECGCDIPHTLRCSGELPTMKSVIRSLSRGDINPVSLFDCTLKNVTFLNDANLFDNVSFDGLVISSGEIKRIHRSTFLGLKKPLQALGLPNNALLSVPWNALAPLTSLDRLDLSNNRIKALGAVDFVALRNLTYLELSDNQISSVSLRTFTPLNKLMSLKLGGNRLGDFPTSLLALGQCINLKELNLESNSIKGPIARNTFPSFGALESLNLNRNLLSSIQNGALQGYPYLITLSLRHNQIDVLQDHAFSGLSSLQTLDLGYNGIVAVSGASLQHLSRLVVLDLTHNFLRALTSDLIRPLPSLRELRLDGNDISIVAKNALDGANELHSLSLEENPLSCDCTLKPFAEWLLASKISSQDLLGATCATPPHLEGAPLLQVPIESLNCDGSNNEFDNENVIHQLDVISKQSNLSDIRDFSDVITLKNLHFSMDFGIILTWSVNMKNDDFTCDAIFVYKESNINEILLDNSPINCESYMMDNENIVSVILQDTSDLVIGENYRFCLVLLQSKNIHRDLMVGCSNITKLEQIESTIDESSESDIATLDKIAGRLPNDNNDNDDERYLSAKFSTTTRLSPPPVLIDTLPTHSGQSFEIFKGMSNSFLPGLGVGILITSIIVLIWGITKLRGDDSNNQASMQRMTAYYMAIGTPTNNQNVNVIENGMENEPNSKTQATTNL